MEGLRKFLNSAKLKIVFLWNIVDLPSDYDCDDIEIGLSEVFAFAEK